MDNIAINKRKRALVNYIKLVTRYFNNPCVDCGKVYHPSSMVFDHKLNEYKKSYKSEGLMYLVRSGYSWKVIKKEINKCEIRCQNCHYLKTAKDFGYWSEISHFIEDHYRLMKKLYKYNGNFLNTNAFNKNKKDISKQFLDMMIKSVKEEVNNKKGALNGQNNKSKK